MRIGTKRSKLRRENVPIERKYAYRHKKKQIKCSKCAYREKTYK